MIRPRPSFTVLEAVLAAVLLALLSGTLLALLDQTARHQQRLLRQQQALFVLDNVLERYAAEPAATRTSERLAALLAAEFRASDLTALPGVTAACELRSGGTRLTVADAAAHPLASVEVAP